tara:strand:- start:55 stop:516 length:462 start_codon:yes stop_codon:yes gene_type:complete
MTDMWDKYRHSSPQTINMIGILILSSKMAMADGDFSPVEKEEILNIIPHHQEQKALLSRIMNEAVSDPHDIYYHARRIKKLLDGENYEFLEFIIAIMYRIAHADHVFDEREENQIKRIAEIFEIKESYRKRTIDFFSTIYSKTKQINFIKKNA